MRKAPMHAFFGTFLKQKCTSWRCWQARETKPVGGFESFDGDDGDVGEMRSVDAVGFNGWRLGGVVFV
jgi:hypothetical protein